MFTDNCQKCSDGYTTLPDEHGTSSDKCSMGMYNVLDLTHLCLVSHKRDTDK